MRLILYLKDNPKLVRASDTGIPIQGCVYRRLRESSGDFYVFDGIDQVIAKKSYFKKVWI
jgi:hypothetical protein